MNVEKKQLKINRSNGGEKSRESAYMIAAAFIKMADL